MEHLQIPPSQAAPECRSPAHRVTKGIINGQGVQTFSMEKLGLSDYARAGCCMIGTYNLIQLLGGEMSLGDVADQYVGGRCGCLLHGLWGAAPWHAGRFLKRFLRRDRFRGYYRVRALDAEVKDGDLVLFFMMNHKYKLSAAFHCMAARYAAGEYEVFNVSNSNTQSCRYQKLADKTKEGHFLYGFIVKPDALKKITPICS